MGTRVTIYVKPEDEAILEWISNHTRADSLSEAVIKGLNELRDLLNRRRVQSLAETHGRWKGDEAVERALRELEEGWRTWRAQEQGS